MTLLSYPLCKGQLNKKKASFLSKRKEEVKRLMRNIMISFAYFFYTCKLHVMILEGNFELFH